MGRFKRRDQSPKARALRDAGTLNPHPDRVRDFLFLENDFFDPRDLVQVKYEMVRRVQKEGRSVSATVAAFGFSRPSFYKAQNVLTREGLQGLIPRKRGPRSRHKLTKEVLGFVLQLQSKEPALRPDALAQQIREKFAIQVHPRTVERALKAMKKKLR